jgi:hypothetical protein
MSELKMKVQSNLSTTATLGTSKKWPLSKGLDIGGRYSQFITIKILENWNSSWSL